MALTAPCRRRDRARPGARRRCMPGSTGSHAAASSSGVVVHRASNSLSIGAFFSIGLRLLSSGCWRRSEPVGSSSSSGCRCGGCIDFGRGGSGSALQSSGSGPLALASLSLGGGSTRSWKRAILVVARLLRPDRRRAGDHDDLVGRRQLHDLAGGQQRPRRLLSARPSGGRARARAGARHSSSSRASRSRCRAHRKRAWPCARRWSRS